MLAQPSLSPQAQTDIARIEEAEIDYLSGLSSEERKARLSRMSYRDFLLNVAKADRFLTAHAGEASASMPFQRLMSGRSASLVSKALILRPVRHRTWDTQPRATPTAPLTRSIFLTEMPRSRGSWCATRLRSLTIHKTLPVPGAFCQSPTGRSSILIDQENFARLGHP